MAESTTLARPYAKASFELARDSDQLDVWSSSLELASAITKDEAMNRMLLHPGLSTEQKAKAFLDICRDKIGEPAQNFVRLLAENKRLILLPYIFELFEKYKSQQEASVEVTVETAFDLSKEQEQNLAEVLKKKLARNVNVHSEVNKSLIGGVVIRAEDLVIDASMRGRLLKMAEAVSS